MSSVVASRTAPARVGLVLLVAGLLGCLAIAGALPINLDSFGLVLGQRAVALLSRGQVAAGGEASLSANASQAGSDGFRDEFSGRSLSNSWDRVDWPEWNAGLTRANVLTSQEGILRLRVNGGDGAGGQINSAQGDLSYGVYRARVKAPPATSGPQGSCGAFFFYRSDVEELDFEFLSARYGYVYFVVQGGDAFRIPVEDPAQRWHVYEFRWYPGEVRVYLDGAPAVGDRVRTGGSYEEDQVLESGVEVATRANIPSRTGKLMLNHWSGNGWAGSPPAGDAEMLVDWVEYRPLARPQMLPLIRAGIGS